MKKRTVLRVFLTILLVIILLPFFPLSLNYCVYNYEDIMNKTVNIPISETCDTELDVYREIIEKCSQEIDQKPLTKVKATPHISKKYRIQKKNTRQISRV